MKGQSEEIRILAVSSYNAGQSPQMLSEIFHVTSRTIYRWVKEAKEGQTAGKKRGHRPRCLSPEEEQRLDDLVRETPDKTLAREQWRAQQASMDSSKLVFVDESAAKTNMVRLRGRSKGGLRCNCFAPCGNGHTTTMLSSQA